jgi:uncharacterized protein with PQ loop repeat
MLQTFLTVLGFISGIVGAVALYGWLIYLVSTYVEKRTKSEGLAITSMVIMSVIGIALMITVSIHGIKRNETNIDHGRILQKQFVPAHRENGGKHSVNVPDQYKVTIGEGEHRRTIVVTEGVFHKIREGEPLVVITELEKK